MVGVAAPQRYSYLLPPSFFSRSFFALSVDISTACLCVLDPQTKKYVSDSVKGALSEEDALFAEAWQRNAESKFISEYNEVGYSECDKVQGLVSMQDSRVQDGGFQTIPGFHRVMAEWTQQSESYSAGHFVPCVTGEPFLQHAFKVSMRCGSLLIWSSLLPHCNYANTSDRFRICQYIKVCWLPLLMCGCWFSSHSPHSPHICMCHGR